MFLFEIRIILIIKCATKLKIESASKILKINPAAIIET